MNFRNYVIFGLTAVLLLNGGCSKSENPVAEGPQASSISGTVRDSLDNPLAGAVVQDLGSMMLVDTTAADGSFGFQLSLSSAYNTTFITRMQGYYSDTTNISLNPGNNVNLNIQLRRNINSPLAGVSGQAASIVLVKQTSATIALKGTGQNESCTLTFEVRDSTGAPVVGIYTSLVKFTIGAGPGGGEFLSPAAQYTNPLTGQVSTTVTSGTSPGVLQVIASTRGDTVKASPTFLAMGAGLPDSAGVSIGATKLNIAGRVYGNLRTTINVAVGDRYGSPVAEGTMVAFKTDPVARLSAFSATTNQVGNASVELISTTNNYAGNSLVQVVASTMGDRAYRPSDSLITRTMNILFSGPTQPPGRNADTYNFTVPDGETRNFHFYVYDDRGQPLVAGTTIKLWITASDTIKNDLELLFGSDGTYTMPDANHAGLNTTDFEASVMDKGRTPNPGFITFGIEIKTPSDVNGNYINPAWFTGYVSGGGAGIFNLPAVIELADTSVSTLFLNETGLTGIRKTLYFVVKDALGNPITPPTSSVVNFSFVSQPAGTTLSATADTTSSSGIVSVDITSGNTPGTAQVQAQTLGVDGLVSAFSRPIEVAHGLPDSDRVLITLSQKNLFNNIGNQIGTVNLTLSDAWGYYAAPQRSSSDIVVSSTGGWVTPVPQTVNGKASVALNGGLPEPIDPVLGAGFGYVYATLRVNGGGYATRSVPFLFSYAPQITFTNTTILDTATGILLNSLNDGSSYDIDFTIHDKNGNPISSGNAVTVTVSGPVADEIQVTGDINLSSLIDTQDPLMTSYRFNVRDKNVGTGSSGAFTVTINVTGESGTAIRTVSGYLLAPDVLGGSSSGYAKSFWLVNPTISRSIYVRGSGGAGTGRPETVALQFEAKDSLGRLVDSDHAAHMHVAFQGETFGASVENDSGITDANGKFTTVVRSGTQSGVPYVYVYAVVNGDTIKSGLVDIIISTGFPVPERFSVSAQALNFPGMQKDGLTDIIRVQLGDRYGNPVPLNTPAWFSSTHGIVQTQAAYSDINGIILQTHYSNGQRPITPNNVPGLGDGFVFVKVRTMGESGQDIWDSVRVLWTGIPVNPLIYPHTGPDPFNIPHAGSAGPFTFEVRDAWGNPLSAGTKITVSAPHATASLDPIELPDTQDGANGTAAPGITNFSVILYDPHESGDTAEPRDTYLQVIIEHPVYGKFSYILFSGTVDYP